MWDAIGHASAATDSAWVLAHAAIRASAIGSDEACSRAIATERAIHRLTYYMSRCAELAEAIADDERHARELARVRAIADAAHERLRQR